MQARYGSKVQIRGFTLLEVLAVVAVVALLVALIVPAVQAAREAARRTHCANNLRQLGIAIGAYESAAGCLPPGANGTHGYSLFTTLLPHLEQGTVFDAINFDWPCVNRTPNLTASRLRLGVLLCPSDVGPRNDEAWTNYAGNEGYDIQELGFVGCFAPNSPDPFSKRPPPATIRSRDFLDGLSTTAAVSEWRLGSARADAIVPHRSIYRTARLQKDGQYKQFLKECGRVDLAGKRANNRGMVWLMGVTGRTLYHHGITPNGVSCSNGFNTMLGAITSGSEHARGVNVLFADGHVAPVSPSIAPPAWKALATRGAGDVADED